MPRPGDRGRGLVHPACWRIASLGAPVSHVRRCRCRRGPLLRHSTGWSGARQTVLGDGRCGLGWHGGAGNRGAQRRHPDLREMTVATVTWQQPDAAIGPYRAPDCASRWSRHHLDCPKRCVLCAAWYPNIQKWKEQRRVSPRRRLHEGDQAPHPLARCLLRQNSTRTIGRPCSDGLAYTPWRRSLRTNLRDGDRVLRSSEFVPGVARP